MHLFGKRDSSSSNKWKAEYDDRLYKIYDWGGNLAGYLFPAYSDIEPKEEEDEEEGDSYNTDIEPYRRTLSSGEDITVNSS